MRSFEEIPDIAERIKRSKMELKESGFYWAPEWDSQSCCDQDYVNNFKKGWESRQTEVDELQNNINLLNEALDIKEQLNQKLHEREDELQKRVDELEFQLKHWKQKSMPAMLNGMCGHCGKEPLQGIVSDKEDYALLHCFGCGANKYEWIGEQALKGGEQ